MWRGDLPLAAVKNEELPEDEVGQTILDDSDLGFADEDEDEDEGKEGGHSARQSSVQTASLLADPARVHSRELGDKEQMLAGGTINVEDEVSPQSTIWNSPLGTRQISQDVDMTGLT